MINLNSTNGADKILLEVANNVLNEFEGNVIGAEFGVAYGGGVEEIGRLWKDRGIIYGFDTFEKHPDFLAKKDPLCDYSKDSFAARCMDSWYSQYSDSLLTIEYIQDELNKQNLNNVILKKGLIDEETNIDYIDKLHYALLDLDIPISMQYAYNAIKNKIIKGAYLCFHDVVPDGHINGLYEFYQNILHNDGYELINEYPKSYLAVLKKI